MKAQSFLARAAHESLISRVQVFRSFYLIAASRFPELLVNILNIVVR